MHVTYLVARYLAAFILFYYGFAKVNGAQFTILDSELDRPMGEVSGFWLTWYYFGYSHLYGGFVALAQIAGACLLLFRKTTLLGACLLVPVVANIILIDIGFGIDASALIVALLLAAMLAIILAAHRRELYDIFWRWQNIPFPALPASRPQVIGTYALRLALIALPALLTYQIANTNNRAPTPIDGIWDVAVASAAPADAPTVVFFEYNRAHMAVFKGRDNTYATHHFEMQNGGEAVTIWQQWLRKGDVLYRGQYDRTAQRITLQPASSANGGQGTITLQRRARQ